MHLTRPFRSLAGDTHGLALMEFALALPLVLGVGLYGVETANLALMNLRLSQVATNLSDNASRVGLNNNLSSQQLREVDINDVLIAARLQGAAWDLTTRGRITVTSLEADGAGNQKIHWQRCLGTRSGADYGSHYGTTSTTAGTDTNSANAGTPAPGGMGPTGAKVSAPPNSGVMFVEINYEYKPVVSARWLPNGSTRLTYTAAYIVRDRRDFAQIYNPAPAVQRMTCDRFTAS